MSTQAFADTQIMTEEDDDGNKRDRSTEFLALIEDPDPMKIEPSEIDQLQIRIVQPPRL